MLTKDCCLNACTAIVKTNDALAKIAFKFKKKGSRRKANKKVQHLIQCARCNKICLTWSLAWVSNYQPSISGKGRPDDVTDTKRKRKVILSHNLRRSVF